MPLALTIKSGNASAAAITSLWDEAGAFEDWPSMRALGYPPHITLAIYDDASVTEAMALAAMATLAEGQGAIALTFDRLMAFDGPPLILWADPEPKEVLLSMHRRAHAAIDPRLCRPHYRPGRFVPHCTLATRIAPDRTAAALEFAHKFAGGLRVIFDIADCVALDPVRSIAEKRLA